MTGKRDHELIKKRQMAIMNNTAARMQGAEEAEILCEQTAGTGHGQENTGKATIIGIKGGEAIETQRIQQRIRFHLCL